MATATYSSGNSGKLIVNTKKLTVRDGGIINTSTRSTGKADNLIINASDSIDVIGRVPGAVNPSLINSSVTDSNKAFQELYLLPSELRGNSGSVTINTNKLNIGDGALISVKNDGSGNAGIININADTINISNNGGLTATTAVGQGGNIAVNSKYVQLNDASISATAGQQGTNGDGGNIIINTDILVAIKNSSITANAFEGQGGNIRIDTKGLFLSPDSKITASSRFGLNGTIQINSLFSNPVQAKAEPEAIRATLEIASVCQSRSGGGKNKFVVTGIDNLLPSPNDLPSNSPIWQDNSLSGLAANNSSGELKFIAQEATPIIEAQALIKKSDGTVVLTAKSDQVIADAALFASLCSAEINSSKN